MISERLKRGFFCAALFLTVAAVWAGPRVQITHPWARVILDNGAVYMTIENKGDTPDSLIKISAKGIRSATLHRTVEEGGVMKMEPLERLTIPARGKAELKPGGLHMMLQGIAKRLKRGDKIAMTFVFEHAGSIPLKVEVKEP